MKLNNSSLLYLIGIGLIMIAISFLGMCSNQKFNSEEVLKQNDIVFQCGTRDRHNPNFVSSDSINLEIGKILFKNNCATCHAKNMKTNATGPALSGIMKNFDKDTMNLVRYVNHHGKYLESNMNEKIRKTDDKYGSISKLQNSNFTKNEIISLIEYIGN